MVSTTTAGLGEMLRMQQGGKPLCDEQIQAVGQGALDQRTRSCSSSSSDVFPPHKLALNAPARQPY